MEYGLIKDTTLKSMADGLREQGIVPKYKTATYEYFTFASPNATSIDDPTPVSEHVDGDQFVISIPEASGIELEITAAVYENPETGHKSTVVASLYGVGASKIDIKRTATQFSSIVSSNTTTVRCFDNSDAAQKDWAAFVIKAYPLNSENERITITRDTEEIATIAPEAMAEAINSFEMPVALPEEAFSITGSCMYRFAYSNWDWFLELYGDRCATSNITDLNYAFRESGLKEIPFTLNITNARTLSGCFQTATQLEVCPKIRGTLATISSGTDLSNLIYTCRRLRDVEDLFEPEILDEWKDFKVTSQYSTPRVPNFTTCTSLRRVPSWWYKFRLNKTSTAVPNASYTIYNSTFSACYALDEVVDIPVWICTAPVTSNLFGSIASNAGRLKKFTFETDNNLPIVANWKSQTIDLANYTGYLASFAKSDLLGYNSGITADKEVKDDATYQALKNDPDWFTINVAYSRYNHDSAVETINSLPDTSAYLATAGGTNTIKFRKGSGALTDGGDISNLTAEEIAVAAAKGWTVTLA